MRIVLTGATGFIGRPLCAALAAAGHSLTVLTREPGRVASSLPAAATAAAWDPAAGPMAETTLAQVAQADAIVNLAGESLGARRWTPAFKERLRSSRLVTTRALVDAMRTGGRTEGTLLSASAVGYYGDRGDDRLNESEPPGRDFLARLCADWEAEAMRAPEGVRVVRARLGVVLGPGGGALARMAVPYRFGVGGPLGSGRQWLSWVHLDDAVGMLAWALEDPEARGPVNVTSPNPVAQRDCARAMGRVLGRPSLVRVPAFALRLAVGEFADSLLTGQRALPIVAQYHGYRWRYPEIEAALRACRTA